MKIIILSGLAGASLLMASCDVEKTQDGEMPEVKVEGGKMPKYNVEGPDVDVKMEEKTIQVPTIDIDPPNDDEDDVVEEPEVPTPGDQ